jgi:hypothetical protein
MRIRSPDTIWYLNLPVMEKENIHVTREYFKTLLKKICDKFSKKRCKIGIITDARAELYFDGRWESVSFDYMNLCSNLRKASNLFFHFLYSGT